MNTWPTVLVACLFAFLLKNANGNLRYFNLPLNRVIELGTQVEI